MSPACSAQILRTTVLSAARIGVIGLAVVAAGCAGGKSEPFPQSSRVAAPIQQAVAGQWKVEIEEDGLPAQLAPRHPRPVADDPREPWSPNYGSRAPQRPAEALPPETPARAVRAPTPAPTPAPTRVSSFDEDDLIRRAIAEHEMRRQ